MKKLLTILFITYACNSYTQTYGNQDSVSVPISGSQNMPALVHVPSDYNTENSSIKHPFIVSVTGANKYGFTHIAEDSEALGYALYNGQWDGNAINPLTNQKEEFITLSLQNIDKNTGITGPQLEYACNWMFSHYRIDTFRTTATGISRGGGTVSWASEHILNANPCTSWTYFAPSHKFAFYIPMSGEINTCDPATYFVSDSSHAWAFGDDTTGGNDIHGVQQAAYVHNINAIAPGLAYFVNYICSAGCPGSTCGHGCWSTFYDSTYKHFYQSDKYSFSSISIYQAALLYTTSNAISTGTISGSPFCGTLTTGASISVPYISTGYYIAGNVFHAQLSSATGDFSSGIYIGTVTTTANSGTISCTIPAGTASGTGYRIRVNSTTPHVVGSNNGSDLAIKLAANSIAPTADQNITVGANGNTLTVTEQSTPTARQWYYGTTSGGPYSTGTGVSTTTYTPNFSSAGIYYLICQSYWSSCATIISNQVKITASSGLRADDQSAFLVQSQGGQVTCHYNLKQSASVRLTVYDEYQRPRASFNGNQNTGSYTYTFDKHLANGVYIVVLQTNQQKIASQKILIGNQ